MSISLYRKYRPQDFGSVVGQRAAIDVLTNSIARSRVGHAYLFSGSRGCGKTSVARIFAKALNCLDRQGFEPCGKCRNCIDITAGDSLDVIEIDGASNNGVENIRGLKENVTLAPFSSKYKIYIIDEVHMLSAGAFNALLKTLEEPPEHVIFIMATTEPHKVPVTIRSRCQHIPFHSITPDDIYSRLKYVCGEENITAEDEALREISRQSDGALRDSLSLLEQVMAAGDVTLENVEALFGAGSRHSFERWIVSLRENTEDAFTALKTMFDSGASAVRVFEEMFSLVRDLWLVSKWKNISDSLGLSESEKKFINEEAVNWESEKLHSLLNNILKALTDARLGMRNNILLGSFILNLYASPDVKAVNLPRPPVFRQKINVQEVLNADADTDIDINIESEIKEDTVLKEELINTAYSKNFMIYCALFDSRPYLRDNDLIINTAHRYCYEVLKIDRTAAELSNIFGNYGRIILTYGRDKTECPKFIAEETGKVKPSARKIKREIPEDKEKNEKVIEVQETQTAKQEPSVFGDFLRRLSSLGMKPEVILLKHNENQENQDDDTAVNEDTEGDSE